MRKARSASRRSPLFSSLIPGYAIEWFGYLPVFVLMGILHPLAYIVIRLTISDREIARRGWEQA